MRIVDVIAYLRTMERALVAALATAGIEARARPDDGPDYTGVWTQERKIASIGVHVARGVTTHGFAVNVDNDLQPFEWVVACGLDGVSMTSVREEVPDDADDVAAEAAHVLRAASPSSSPRPSSARRSHVALDRLDAALVAS